MPRAVVIRPPAGLPRFGALIWLNLLFVDQRLEAAPRTVISAIVAHEYGHAAKGHAAVALAVTLAALAPMAVPSGPAVSTLVRIAAAILYVAVVAGLLWLRRPRREREADTFAATVVGEPSMIAALDWMAASTGNGWTASLLERRSRLAG